MNYHHINFIETEPTHWATDKSFSVNAQKAVITLNARNQNLSSFLITAVLQHLTKLDLSKNSLTELVFDLDMPDLEFLDLSYNQVPLERVIFKGRFPKLKYLYVYQSQLQSIVFENAMPSLEILNLGENKLEAINLPLGFEELASLNLANNQIKNVGLNVEDIFQSTKNRKYALNPANFPKLEYLNLKDNPLTDIPREIIAEENCIERYRNYFISYFKSPMIYLHEAKMILVGNGEVGKTSIRLKLLDRNAVLPKKADRTQGLEIATYSLKNLPTKLTQLNTPIDFDLHIWDFGGQGKYREVQQLFCSRKSLYLFVTAVDDEPSKEDYVNFDYWFSMAKTYGFDAIANKHSPIIPICNKMDKEKAGFHDFNLKRNYKNIPADLIKISCEELTNFEPLVETIKNTLTEVSSDIFTNKYSQNWLNVKDTLEQRKGEHYITYDAYLEICTNHNLNESEAKSWLEILNIIGTVIYFGENEGLKDWIILNPNWVKTAIYEIIDKAEKVYFIKDGALTPQHFAAIWHKYSEKEREKLLILILEFELCYENKNIIGEPIYIFPCLLGDAPNLTNVAKIQTVSHALKFEYPNFIPAGTVNKLMVVLNKMIYNNLKWKNGFVIEANYTNAYATIQESWEDKAIYVNLCGNDVKPLFNTIIQGLTYLNNKLEQTKLLPKLEMNILGKDEDGEWVKLSTLIKYNSEYSIFENIESGTHRGFIPGEMPDFKIPKHKTMTFEEIKNLITNNELLEALEALEKLTSKRYNTTVTLLQSQVNSLNTAQKKGTISHDNATVRQAQLSDNILSILNDFLKDGLIVSNPKEDKNIPNENQNSSKTNNGKRKILFLSANPSDSTRLKTDNEHRKIKDEMLKGQHRDNFEFLPPEFAVTVDALQRAFTKNPHIVHFSGHGLTKGIVITNDSNTSVVIPTSALKRLFKRIKDSVEFVLLNSCYSAEQAKVISAFGVYVIGNNAPIGDDAAIAFAKGLYTGLSEGKGFDDAFDFAMFELETVSDKYTNVIEVWKDGVQLDL